MLYSKKLHKKFTIVVHNFKALAVCETYLGSHQQDQAPKKRSPHHYIHSLHYFLP